VRSVVAVAILLVAVPASAHVTVQPKTAKVGSQEFSVRVPTEKEVPTTAVRVVFPEGFEVLRFKPAPGWKYEVERDASGRISGVTWSGGKIGREEYEQFQFMARTRTPGTYKLDAYQTYEGNDVVGWVEQDGKRPAPQVTIEAVAEGSAAATASADPFAPGAEAEHQHAGAAPATAPVLKEVTAGPATWMGGAAVVIALAALVFSLRSLRQKRSFR
jgi:YD repeat-containing protein